MQTFFQGPTLGSVPVCSIALGYQETKTFEQKPNEKLYWVLFGVGI